MSSLLRILPLLVGAIACSSPAGNGGGKQPIPHPTDTADAATPDFSPGAFPRLTATQYDNMLVDLLGDVPDVTLPDDTYPYLFATIGASTDALSESGVQAFEEAAHTAAHGVFGDETLRLERVGCTPTAPGDACVRGFLTQFGRRAWRRPLEDWEQERWVGVATELADGDPWLGLEMAVAGMLQSPWTLYRVERGHPHATDPQLLELNGYEVATRLSLLLWNTIPDDTLLHAAEQGELDTAEGRRLHAERLLADPRADTAILEFFAQYLDLARLDRAHPDPATYPTFTPTLQAAMRTEVLLLVDDIVNRSQVDARTLFSARRAYVNDELAAHYGLPTEGLSPITFAPVELPANSERAGILGLGAFLTMNAHAVDTSPTLRGKYLLERVLCLNIPPPPGSVDLDLSAEDGEATTLRDRLEQHRSDPACAGCHAIIDPPGYLFEHFDAIGAWRDLDNGAPVDSSGELFGEPLTGAGALGDLLADHPDVGPCMVRQVFRHAHARLDTDADTVTLAQLSASFAEDGHRFRDLLVNLVAHESFVVVARPEEGVAP